MTDILAAVRRWVAWHHDPTPDADLLARFATGRDAEAFKSLVGRHGGLVWAVCRRMRPADPEDAFQATFLALVRSAGRIRSDGPLGGWLHRTAVRVCLQARRATARRIARERAAARRESVEADPGWDGVQAAVHEEVERLPGPLRVVFVLCELQGVRPVDAAAQLGWKAGTLTGRLCKARQMLQARLTARGLAPGAVVAVLSVEAAGCPVGLALAVLDTGPGDGPGVSQAVLELARGATKGTMMTSKLVIGAALVVGLAAVSGGRWSPAVTGQDNRPAVSPAPAGAQRGAVPAAASPTVTGQDNRPAVTPAPAGAPQGAMPAAASPTARKWEYKFVGRPQANVLPGMVAQYGEDGWELAAVLAMTRDEVRAAFAADPKRVLDADGATALLVFKRPAGVEFPPSKPNQAVPAGIGGR